MTEKLYNKMAASIERMANFRRAMGHNPDDPAPLLHDKEGLASLRVFAAESYMRESPVYSYDNAVTMRATCLFDKMYTQDKTLVPVSRYPIILCGESRGAIVIDVQSSLDYSPTDYTREMLSTWYDMNKLEPDHPHVRLNLCIFLPSDTEEAGSLASVEVFMAAMKMTPDEIEKYKTENNEPCPDDAVGFKVGCWDMCLEAEYVGEDNKADGMYSIAGVDIDTVHPMAKKMFLDILRVHVPGVCNQLLPILHYLDLPSKYIVMETPAHVAENPEKYAKRAKLKIPRWADRERWLVLDPEEIRTRWPRRESQGGSHASPVPHMRRGHTKMLSHERYTAKRGQIIRVRPSWVGDRDWANGRAKYKVVSRVGADETQA